MCNEFILLMFDAKHTIFSCHLLVTIEPLVDLLSTPRIAVLLAVHPTMVVPVFMNCFD